MVMSEMTTIAISTLKSPAAGTSDASWSSADDVETATVIT